MSIPMNLNWATRFAFRLALLLVAGSGTAAAQETIPPCPRGSLVAFTFDPIAPVVQEQPVTITGTMTTNQPAPCLVMLAMQRVLAAGTGPQLFSTAFPVGPGTTTFSVDIDQPESNPIIPSSPRFLGVAIYSADTALFGSPSLFDAQSMALAVIHGDRSEGEGGGPTPTPTITPTPMVTPTATLTWMATATPTFAAGCFVHVVLDGVETLVRKNRNFCLNP